jgi:hypothetical protein
MKLMKTAALAGAVLVSLASAASAQSLPGRSFSDAADACNAAGCGDKTWSEIAQAAVDGARAPAGSGFFIEASPFLRYEVNRDPAVFPYNDGQVCNDLDGNNPNPVQPVATFANPRLVFEGIFSVEAASTNIQFDAGIDGRIQSDFAASQTNSNGAVWYALWILPDDGSPFGQPTHFGYVTGSGEGTNSVFGRASTSGTVAVDQPSPPRGGPLFLDYRVRMVTWQVPSPAPLFVTLRAASCQPRLLLTSGFDFGPSPFSSPVNPAK